MLFNLGTLDLVWKPRGAAIIQVRPLLAQVQYFSKYLYIFILVKEQ